MFARHFRTIAPCNGRGLCPRHGIYAPLKRDKYPFLQVEPVVGLEPTTDGLQNRCSTTELNWQPTPEQYRTAPASRKKFLSSAPDIGEGILFCHKRSQNSQILHVLVQVGGLGSLQATGQIAKSIVVYDVAKRMATNFSLSDSGMTIHLGAEVGFGIVEMKSHDLVHTDKGIDLADSIIPAFGRAQIVARFEEMRRVEADPETLRFLTRSKWPQDARFCAPRKFPARGVLQRDSNR